MRTENSTLKWVADLYREIYTRCGGRPWTFIIRDFAHQNPLLWLILGVWLGIWLGHYWLRLDIWLWFSSGVLAGHLFWGTRYHPNEGLNERNAGERR